MSQVQTFAECVIANIEQVIVGKRDAVELAVVGLLCQGHLLIEDVPGVGKTMLARSMARSLGCSFSRIQFTPDMLPSDVTGVSIFNQASRQFEFRPGPVVAQIVLADEINRATPKTQSALLEAMQEHSVTVGGVQHRLKEPFFVMATQNPIEQEGTYPLPEAQLDRFFFKLLVGYSDRQELSTILQRTTTGYQPDVRPVMSGEEIIARQQLVRRIVVAPHVQDYIIRLVLATHPQGAFATEMVNKYVRWGSSPRGAQALTLAGKIYAMLDGRYNVSFADAQRAVLPGLRHRLLLNFEGEAEGLTTDEILNDIVDKVETAVEAAA